MNELDARIAALSPEKKQLLGRFLRGMVRGQDRSSLVGFRRDPGIPIPLSFAQQRLWFLDQLDTVGATYHIAMNMRLFGVLDIVALRKALNRIIARHEILRTAFVEIDGEPTQQIASPKASSFLMIEHDLRAHIEAEREFRRIVAEEGNAPFHLNQGPLIRGRLARLAENDHALLITMHHIVADAWSEGVFIRELSMLYGAFQRGAKDPLPRLPVQYADYAVWQRRWLAGDILREQTEYWKHTLAGVPEQLGLPTVNPRPAQQDYAGAMVPIVLDKALTLGLKTLSQRNGTTLFMTLLAGWAEVLGQLSHQDDVVIGVPTENRGQIELEGLIGCFVNTLALRVNLSGAPTVAEILARVKTCVLGGQEHKDVPFEQVVALMKPVRSLAYNPLFQVFFSWQNVPSTRFELPGITLLSVDAAPHLTAKFDLALSLREEDGQIVGGLEYAIALFNAAAAARYVRYLRTMLATMAVDTEVSA